MVSEDGSTDGHDPPTAASKRASRRLSAFNALAALGKTNEGEVAEFGEFPNKGEDDLPTKGEEDLPTKEQDGTPTEETVQEPALSDAAEPGTASRPIIVADFAFPDDDPRFSKRPHELLTRAERALLDPSSDPPAPPSDDDGDDGDWDAPEDGWSTAWLASGRSISEAELTPKFGSAFAEGEDQTDQGDGTLPPGIYRALYAFEAEGTAEMSLDEGQFVKVVGKGGGVGWAVVERAWTFDASGGGEEEVPTENEGSGALGLAGQALVPEGYLEIWRLDGEEW